MIGRITETVNCEGIERNLEKYKKLALELGATDVKLIDAQTVPVDERVYYKCLYPRCLFYGTNANCPPHSLSITPEATRTIIGKYNHALLLRIKGASEVMVDPKRVAERRDWQLKVYEIVSKVEGEAFRDGYYFAMGFSGGPCKRLFCMDDDCVALQGKPCKAYYKARTPMEGAGIDVYKLVTKAGWEMFPIGERSDPTTVPFGQWVGLVLIA